MDKKALGIQFAITFVAAFLAIWLFTAINHPRRPMMLPPMPPPPFPGQMQPPPPGAQMPLPPQPQAGMPQNRNQSAGIVPARLPNQARPPMR